ncbi:hypothetical protein B0H19DRAFT_244231 [Mycena capillaripes]|nr:hypothetical protein B0H19DRAFT_244231 [Mycena capillaripes]
MSTPGIVLTSDLTAEVVEFWGFKYKEAKQELDVLKQTGTQGDTVQSYGELKRLVQHLQIELAQTIRRLEANDKLLQEVISASRNEQKTVQQKLETCNAEKNDLLQQIGRLNNDRFTLHHQIQVTYSQAGSLAAEAHRQRVAVVKELFNPGNSFVDDSFTPVSIVFTSAQRLVAGLRRDATSSPWQLYFNPQPPNSIPIQLESPGQAGYWFCPFNLDPMDAPFELIVEVEPNTWRYFGRYVTRLLQGYEMKLSEWMTLDEQLKSIFCLRVADKKVPMGQQTSYATQYDVRQRYDSGQWNIPCYSLQCVGYDMALYEALTASAVMLRCDQEVSISKTQSLGKRRRTETPSACELGGESAKAEGPRKNTRIEVTQDGVGELELTQVKGE